MRGDKERRRLLGDLGASPQKKKKQHVLLFRHCVRSTDARVVWYNSTNSSAVPLRDFWPPLIQPEVVAPNWNVPTNWCTEQSVQQMHDTGIFIYNTFLRSVSGDARPFKFRFLSDMVQRDADSTLALQEGLASAYMADLNTNTSSLSSSNLHVTEYVPHLFDPFVATSISADPVCSLQVTSTQWLQEIHTRLHNIRPPTMSMWDTLKVLQLVDENAPKKESHNDTPTLVFDINNGPRMTGMINVIKLAVQTLFYSRAAGIAPLVFLPGVTNTQIYQQLLPWVHYSRSILNVGTTEAASRGAVLLRTMVEAMQHSEEDTVTVLVGHDTDLDAVATALHAVWAFDAPYSTAEERVDWYSTPPGSAMYMTHEPAMEEDDAIVTLSYLYPVFDLNEGTILSWESVPLQLRNVSSSLEHFPMNENATTLTFAQFQTQLRTNLQRYSGATECYDRALDIPVAANTVDNRATSFGSGVGTGIAISLFLVVLGWMYQNRRQQRRRTLYSVANSVHHRNEAYDPVGDNIEKVDLT